MSAILSRSETVGEKGTLLININIPVSCETLASEIIDIMTNTETFNKKLKIRLQINGTVSYIIHGTNITKILNTV